MPLHAVNLVSYFSQPTLIPLLFCLIAGSPTQHAKGRYATSSQRFNLLMMAEASSSNRSGLDKMLLSLFLIFMVPQIRGFEQEEYDKYLLFLVKVAHIMKCSGENR